MRAGASVELGLADPQPSRTSLGRAPASQQGLETRQGSAEAEPVNDQLDLGKELQSGKSVPAWGVRGLQGSQALTDHGETGSGERSFNPFFVVTVLVILVEDGRCTICDD